MQIFIDVDGLRTISTISVDAATKMDEANSIVTTVVSQHNWKCPERVRIDEALETIKNNFIELSNTFTDFSVQITNIANSCTDFINEQTRMNLAYMDDVASIISELNVGNVISGSSHGGSIVPICGDLSNVTLDSANFNSLHSASDPINIMDFSSFQ